MTEDLTSLVARLRVVGGDVESVEVKSAEGGLPLSLGQTLSAMANRPGGGLIILGLDERTGFRPVRLTNPQALKQGLAAKARNCAPPVGITIRDALVDGEPVVVARVHECDSSAKPCRIAPSGEAYLRGYDGDFRLSDLEEQAFLAQRRPPAFDRVPVSGATRSDLDHELVVGFLSNVRDRDSDGLGRYDDDGELLHRAGVLSTGDVPTVAGVLALGLHPQQWFPRHVVQVAADPLPDGPSEARARNAAALSGPVPRMLEQAMRWARRNFDTTIVSEPDGTVRDRPAFPFTAFRELVANALVHRDMDNWSAGRAVEVRLRRDRLVITNPGGLYGVTVDRLGRENVTSARNALLLNICRYVPLDEPGARVVEALATGIPIVTAELEHAGLPPAHYVDAGISFTVVLRPGTNNAPVAPKLSTTQLRVYQALAGGRLNVAELQTCLGLTAPNIRKALRALGSNGLVEQHGGPGQPTWYARTAE